MLSLAIVVLLHSCKSINTYGISDVVKKKILKKAHLCILIFIKKGKKRFL